MSVFEFLKYQNAKTHEQLFIWRNRTTSPKICILIIFHIVKYEKVQYARKAPYIWKGKDISINVSVECLLTC